MKTYLYDNRKKNSTIIFKARNREYSERVLSSLVKNSGRWKLTSEIDDRDMPKERSEPLKETVEPYSGRYIG